MTGVDERSTVVTTEEHRADSGSQRVRWLPVTDRAVQAVHQQQRRGILVPEGRFPWIARIAVGRRLRLTSKRKGLIQDIEVVITGLTRARSTDRLPDAGRRLGITAAECSGVPDWSWGDYAEATVRMAPKGEPRDHRRWFLISFEPTSEIEYRGLRSHAGTRIAEGHRSVDDGPSPPLRRTA